MSRIGVDRILRFAFELARSRGKKHLTSATKSNGISITMPYWDERVEEMAKSYPGRALGQVPHRHPVRAFRAQSRPLRRGRRLQSVRRHPVRSRPGLHRHDRHRAVRQHQSRTRRSRRCSSRCTARRPTLPARASPTRSARSGRRDDARASRRPEAAAAIVSAIETVLADPAIAHRATSAAAPTP